MTAFSYNLDLTTLSLYAASCASGGFPSPRVCESVLQDAGNAYAHYAGWNVSNMTQWLRTIPILEIIGDSSAVIDTLQVEFDCHFVPDDTIDHSDAPSVSCQAVGRHGTSAAINTTASLSDDIRDETVHHVTSPVGTALLGETASEAGVFVEITIHMSGGHAVGGSGPYVYISNVVISGTWHPLGTAYTPISITPASVSVTVGETQEFTTNKAGDWLLSPTLDPDPDGASHDGTDGTLQAPGTISNDSGEVVVAVGKQSGLFTAPLVPGTYYLYVWDAADG